MLPTTYDIRIVEERNRDLRREADAYRLAQASRPAVVPAQSLFARIRSLMMRLHLVRLISDRVEAPARSPRQLHIAAGPQIER